jgi:hypothetical protein
MSATAKGDEVILSSWFAGTVQILDRKTVEIMHDFKAPHDAIRLGDGSLLVNELGSKSLVQVTGHGKDRKIIATDLNGPVGLVAADDKTVYLTEAFSGQVLRIDLGDDNKAVVAKDLKMPEGIALTPGRQADRCRGRRQAPGRNRSAEWLNDRDRRQPADRAGRIAGLTAHGYSHRRRDRRLGGDLFLIRYRERDLQGGEEIEGAALGGLRPHRLSNPMRATPAPRVSDAAGTAGALRVRQNRRTLSQLESEEEDWKSLAIPVERLPSAKGERRMVENATF